MKYLLLIPVLLLIGCATDSEAVRETPDDYEMLAEEDMNPQSTSGRFMGNMRDAWGEHLRDCQTGLEFTGRTLSRNTERGWDRIVWWFQ
jgi:hypothetical protein